MPPFQSPRKFSSSFFKRSWMDAAKVPEKLARKKAEIKRMGRWLKGKELAVKRMKKELQTIKRQNKKKFKRNRRMEKMIDDFLVAAEAENSDLHTAKIWTEKAMKEVIEGMNDLNLEGNSIVTVNQVQSCCTTNSAADGDSN